MVGTFIFNPPLESNLHVPEFPEGSVVRTQCSHCQGARVQSLVKDLRFYMLCGYSCFFCLFFVFFFFFFFKKIKKTLLAPLGPAEQSGPFRSGL